MSDADTFCLIVPADTIDEACRIMKASRDCLNRWAKRHAKKGDAHEQVVETQIIMEQIDLWVLRTTK